MAYKILVVDDEPDLELLIRQKFRKQIRDNEYEFAFAQNGVEALTTISRQPDIGMVLSDINMPEMDGLTLLQKLGELKNPALMAVIVSAYGDMDNIRTAMNRGAFDFLTKPIDFNDLEATITKTIVQLEVLKQAIRDREQLLSVRNDLTTAARIQQSILPQKFPPFPDRHEVDVYAQMTPAKEVGGDFYDFFFIDQDRLAFLIGDVSGKGVPAAIFMAVSRTLLKAIATQVVNPGESLRRLNQLLIPESNGRMFVTIFYGILNTRTGDVQFSFGAHNPPFIKRKDGTVERISQDSGFLLGMMDDMEYDVHKVTLRPGDTILLYTDGVTEAMNGNAELFAESRLVEALARSNGAPLPEMLRGIQDDILKFAAGTTQSDDITMLALQYRGKGAS
ncbi:MAG TPA: SpoIIE family protein phosphatase [Bacteroidota bacterium]|nr:SpoIIE family protein phosphatase [Bacteroidota bacterium]